MKFQKLTPNLVVNDVKAAMDFYRTVLGFQACHLDAEFYDRLFYRVRPYSGNP